MAKKKKIWQSRRSKQTSGGREGKNERGTGGEARGDAATIGRREGERERAVISRSERSTQAERREIMWKSVISEWGGKGCLKARGKKKIKEILPARIRDPPVRGQLKWINCFPFCLRLLQRGSSPQSCSLVSLSEANSNLQLHLTMPDTLLRVSAPITQAFGSLSFPQNNEGLSIYYLLEKMFVFFRKQSVRESNVNVRFGVEWREGVWHRCRPVRFHHSACKFWPRTAAATEDGEGHRAGGEGWGVCRKWIEWGSEREEEGEWDDRAAGSLFVHASAGKLITRWSSTPLKC